MTGSAQAANVRVDRACYPGDGDAPVKVSGEGYLPGADYLLLLDGGVVASGTTGADGRVETELQVPSPPETGSKAHDRGHKVEIRQGSLTASAGFRSARVFGDFNPGNGDPKRLKVRFSAFGFGIDTPPGKKQSTIYVHYVDRRGKARKTVKLGRGRGSCGSIRRTAKRKLFPFRPSSGTWALQFDTRRRYVKGTARSKFVWDRLTLKISKR